MRNTPTETSYQMNNLKAHNIITDSLALAGTSVPPAVAYQAMRDLVAHYAGDLVAYCDAADEAMTAWGGDVWQSKIVGCIRAGIGIV